MAEDKSSRKLEKLLDSSLGLWAATIVGVAVCIYIVMNFN